MSCTFFIDFCNDHCCGFCYLSLFAWLLALLPNSLPYYFLSFWVIWQVGNSVCVIELWHHHHPMLSLSSVYSDSGYIINGSNFLGSLYIGILPHKCTSSNLGMCYIYGIWGGIFVAGTYFAIILWINVAVYWFMMDLCRHVGSICWLQ